ncbi:MAG TPA: Hsp20/alpha crystallin family protein [Thermodesulfobacteriota bacterium]|nr:Hsp20/alpha crystallin family protein [Thermodesulfobacteriota bacterium]
MLNKQEKNIQVKEKQEVASPAEQTMTGLVFVPMVDIFETDEELTILADMPGVKADNLKIDLDNNILTMIGDVEAPESPGERDILREYQTGRYFRQFTVSDVIDQSKIEAVLTDGVLRLRLPKAETAKPRQIPVQVG